MGSDLMLVVMFVVDFVAFGLALAAEQLRSTAKFLVDKEKNYCSRVYDSNVTTYLGTCAIVLFLISQVLMIYTNRSSTKSPILGARRTCSVLLSIITWTTYFIGEACLLVGVVNNAQSTRYKTLYWGYDCPDCLILRAGVFEGRATSILISMVSMMNYVHSSMSEHGSHDSDRKGSNELGSYTSLP